ncbi:Ig-like domain-containing protein [Microlunatus flavus]|uniref:Conserved repeat domain-containing protein n=1 Tax=Microlunatus flavus TaxID=1036181 RepID=A0A1H9LV79_9ACTN|nr:hypothetical protein [Microlunatus flavus]SER15159.1 conserved repeat domain-containing protein [Microlunatus flavus]
MPARPSAPLVRRSTWGAPLVLLAGLGLLSAAPSTASAAGVGPTVVDDAAVLALGSPAIVLPGSWNDTAGSEAIQPSLTSFPTDQLSSLPPGSSVASYQVVDAGFGTWSLNDASGEITFRSRGVAGTRTVRYRVVDARERTDEGTATVTVSATSGARADQVVTVQGAPASVDVLANDRPGFDADGTRGTLDRSTLRWSRAQSHAVVSADGLVLTSGSLGTFTIDATTRRVTYVPAPTYTGDTGDEGDPLTYEVQDTTRTADGHVTHHLLGSALRWKVTPAPAAADGLSVTATASPTSVATAGQQVGYRVSVRNRGDRAARALLVSAPGLPALTCSPVALGGSLGAGAATTCRGTRTVVPAHLSTSALTARVKASAVPVGATAAVNAVVSVSVRVAAASPVATDDTVPAVDGGPSVLLPGATNDRPSAAGGPALDPTRTVLVGGTPDAAYGDRAVTTADGRWAVLPDGSVRFTPAAGGHAGTTAQLSYRVYDVAGRSAVGRLAVPLRRGPTAAPIAVTTAQGTAVTVDVLAEADPGLNADGSPATFDRTTLELASVSPTAGRRISTVADRSSIRIQGVGDFVQTRDWTLTFDASPYPGFAGTVPTLTYEALTTGGTRLTGTLSVTVPGTPVPPTPAALPEASDDHGVTTTQLPVTLAAQSNDVPGIHPLVNAKLGFLRDQVPLLPAGTRIEDVGSEQRLVVPGQGVYQTRRAAGTIVFTPSPDFVGTVPPVAGYVGDTIPVGYSITDTYGNHDYATLTVTILPGASAEPDAATTRQGRRVDVNVLLNDYPGRSPQIGTPSRWLDPRLTTRGLPAGSTTSAGGSRLTVPGQGSYAVSPGNQTVGFTPERGFRGTAGPVTVALRDRVPVLGANPAVLDLTSTLTVTVLGSDPVAKPDTATTAAGEPVVVPVLANDLPGSPAVPLVAPSVRLRTTPGLPSGSVLAGDAKTLAVAGHGTFLVSVSGQITFVPSGTATGPVPPVGYQVADVNGTTARSTFDVTVR